MKKDNMKEIVNKILCLDCFELLRQIPNNVINLIILDPPYYKIKGKFDFEMTFEEWKKLHEKLAKEFERVLNDNGSIFLFGHAKNIAYQQIIFDKYFELKNSLVWEKKECRTRKNIAYLRTFAPVTERILLYSNQENDTSSFDSIREYLGQEVKKTGKSKKELNRIIGCSNMVGHYFADKQWELPSQEKYEKLQTTGFFKKPYLELRQEYEKLQQEYKKLCRPFNNYLKLTDVIRLSQESHITKKYNHPTQKPPSLVTALIKTCSRKNDLILDCMAGSFITAECAKKVNRNFITCDKNQEYCEIGRKRIKQGVLRL